MNYYLGYAIVKTSTKDFFAWLSQAEADEDEYEGQ